MTNYNQYQLNFQRMKTSIVTILSFLNLWIQVGLGLIGYDCGKQYKGTKAYSLTEVEQCPEIPGWFQDPIPVELQLIRIPKKETLKTTVCELRKTKIVQYCGKLDSLIYGVPIILEKDKPYAMSKLDCEQLVKNKQFSYGGETWYTDATQFSKDIMVKGFRNEETGSCTADSFRSHGKYFDHHVMRDIITVNIVEESHQFNYEEKAVKFNHQVVPLDEEFYDDSTRTIIWENPFQTCQFGSNFRLAFEGKGMLYRPTNTNLLDMVLVHHVGTSQTFGIEIKSQDSKCGHTMYSTQLEHVKITLNLTEYNGGETAWRVTNLPRTRLEDVDPVQNLKSLVGYNYVSQVSIFNHNTNIVLVLVPLGVIL